MTLLLINVLKDIKKHGPIDLSSGICDNVKAMLRSKYYPPEIVLEVSLQLGELMDSWPLSRGDPCFPVYDPDSEHSPRKQYLLAVAGNTMWDKCTNYGKLRYELLDFLIERLEQDQ